MARRSPDHVAVTQTSRSAYRSAVVDRGVEDGIAIAILASIERAGRPLSGRELDVATRLRHEHVSAAANRMKKNGDLRVHHSGLDRETQRTVEFLCPGHWTYSEEMERLCAEAAPPPAPERDGRTVSQIILDFVWEMHEAGQFVNRRQIEKGTGLTHQSVAVVRRLINCGELIVDHVEADRLTKMDVEWLRPARSRPPRQGNLL